MAVLHGVVLVIALLLPGTELMAQPVIPVVTLEQGPEGQETYAVSLQILAAMTALMVLPAALLMMTSFTRIVIVLAILRQALGTQQTPANPILIGLALFLTLFIMGPVFEQVYDNSVQPYLEEELSLGTSLERAQVPLRSFMMEQTREADLAMFADISGQPEFQTADDVPFTVLVPAFVTSELKTAFQFGFLLFIPFLIIDLVVASVLMAMGMVMLSPMIVSFPFKLMLFVLVDGWTLVIGSLASSYNV